MHFEPHNLIDLVTTKMPYGKYQGTPIYKLPEFYLVWYHQKGYPHGKIGALLALMYEIRLNGLEYMLQPIISKYKTVTRLRK